MDYLVISNLLVVGALFFITCPNECRGSSLDHWPRDYNTYDDSIWRVIPLKRMDDHGESTIVNGEITPGIKRQGVPEWMPTQPDPNNLDVISDPAKESLQLNNDVNEENKEVRQQLTAAERRFSRALSPDLISSAPVMECQKYRRLLRRLCVVSVPGKAKEQMAEGSSDTAVLNKYATLLFLTTKN